MTKIVVEDIETADVTSEAGKEIELPKTVNVTYNTEKDVYKRQVSVS